MVFSLPLAAHYSHKGSVLAALASNDCEEAQSPESAFPNWYGDQLLRRFQSTGAGVVPSQSPRHLGLYADG